MPDELIPSHKEAQKIAETYFNIAIAPTAYICDILAIHFGSTSSWNGIFSDKRKDFFAAPHQQNSSPL